MKEIYKNMKAWISLAGLVVFLQGCPCPAYEYPQVPKVGNFARTIITEADGLTTNETEITLAAVTNFPAITSTNEYYYLTLIRTGDNAKEIVKVTSADTTNKVLTVVRAQDGTRALAFSQNDRAELWVTAGLLEDYRDEQRGYVEQKAEENALDLTSANAVISNILLRLSAVVGTGKLDIATFDATAFTVDTNGNISIKAGGIKTADYAAESITAEKIKTGEDLTPWVTFSPATTAASGVVTLASSGDMSAGTNAVKVTTVKQVQEKAIEQAKNYSMKYTNAVVRTGTVPTSWTDLNLSGVVGTNRAFVHLKFEGGSLGAAVRPNGETKDVNAGYTIPTGTLAGYSANGEMFACSTITDESGIIEIKNRSYEGATNTTISVICYQVLQ